MKFSVSWNIFPAGSFLRQGEVMVGLVYNKIIWGVSLFEDQTLRCWNVEMFGYTPYTHTHTHTHLQTHTHALHTHTHSHTQWETHSPTHTHSWSNDHSYTPRWHTLTHRETHRHILTLTHTHFLIPTVTHSHRDTQIERLWHPDTQRQTQIDRVRHTPSHTHPDTFNQTDSVKQGQPHRLTHASSQTDTHTHTQRQTPTKNPKRSATTVNWSWTDLSIRLGSAQKPSTSYVCKLCAHMQTFLISTHHQSQIQA